MNTKTRNIAIVLVVAAILVAGLVYYRQLLFDVVPPIGKSDTTAARQVSATVTYDVPSGSDTERYTVLLDNDGVIVGLKAVNVKEPDGDAQAHLNEFAQNLFTVVEGKKLSELGPVDKVGSSSLTTAAFNSALPELKSQL